MFDLVEIKVQAGNGGDGVVSFRREKFVPFGGPDGGDGGDGGDVIIAADDSVTDLRSFKGKSLYRAGDGRDGKGQKKHGKQGKEIILSVPPGTMIIEKEQTGNSLLIGNLEYPGTQEVVARGGKGGFGNTHFVSSTNQAPKIAQAGAAGEERLLVLEMRLIADVGIIGFPNVGKSTLLAAASAATPKIAGYPFTTREPSLGVVDVGYKSFILAEIPGLVTGAHLGKGLGHKFLRHTMRTRILIHLMDGCSAPLLKDMMSVNRELILFDSVLGEKPQLVVVNKIDLPEVKTRLNQIRDDFKSVGIDVNFISAVTGEGVDYLMEEAANLLVHASKDDKKVPCKVFRPKPRGEVVHIYKEGEVFVVVAPELERYFTRTDISGPDVRWQLNKQLSRLGVNRALRKARVKPGDKVRCGNLEWEW